MYEHFILEKRDGQIRYIILDSFDTLNEAHNYFEKCKFIESFKPAGKRNKIILESKDSVKFENGTELIMVSSDHNGELRGIDIEYKDLMPKLLSESVSYKLDENAAMNKINELSKINYNRDFENNLWNSFIIKLDDLPIRNRSIDTSIHQSTPSSQSTPFMQMMEVDYNNPIESTEENIIANFRQRYDYTVNLDIDTSFRDMYLSEQNELINKNVNLVKDEVKKKLKSYKKTIKRIKV